MQIGKRWKEASLLARVAYCGALLYWVCSTLANRAFWEHWPYLVISAAGLLLTLVYGLHVRKPEPSVTRLGVSSASRIQD